MMQQSHMLKEKDEKEQQNFRIIYDILVVRGTEQPALINLIAIALFLVTTGKEACTY